MAASRTERVDRARQVLESSREAAQRTAQAAGERDLRGLLERAQADLERRLADLDAKGLEDSFTAVQLRGALLQVEVVLGPLVRGMRNVMQNSSQRAAEQAAINTIEYLAEAERAFAGSVQPLALDRALILNAAVRGANASVLRRIASGPPSPKYKKAHRHRKHARLGVLERYGVETIGHFERTLQAGMVAKKSWKEMRDDITADSDFLKGAPKHWAQRVVRVEVMNAYGSGAAVAINEAHKQLGDMLQIISETFDERTAADSFCQHGMVRRPGEDFDGWYGPYSNPPQRPNDRAVLTPHRMSWPLPPYLRPKTDEQVLARWRYEGRKGEPPPRPLMSTVDVKLIGGG